MQKTLETLATDDGFDRATTALLPESPELLVEPIETDSDGSESAKLPEETVTSGQTDGGSAHVTQPGAERADSTGLSETDAEQTHDLPEAKRAHRDRWYIPDSDTYAYTVKTPDGDRAYRKTTESVARLLTKYYREEK